MFRSRIETTNFSFEAYGNTEKEAIANLKKTMQAHAIQYKVAKNQVWNLYKEDVHTYEIRIGMGLRDHEEIKS